MKASLLRAGDHIAAEVPTYNSITPEGDLYVFKLAHVIPPECRRAISAYIRGYGKEQGWRVKRVRHKKFFIEILTEPE